MTELLIALTILGAHVNPQAQQDGDTGPLVLPQGADALYVSMTRWGQAFQAEFERIFNPAFP